MNHTPGPWTVEKISFLEATCDPSMFSSTTRVPAHAIWSPDNQRHTGEFLIARVEHWKHGAEHESAANASLISAAPDLLVELQIARFRLKNHVSDSVLAQMDKVIAKATAALAAKDNS